jgi:hypothetical protein
MRADYIGVCQYLKRRIGPRRFSTGRTRVSVANPPVPREACRSIFHGALQFRERMVPLLGDHFQ